MMKIPSIILTLTVLTTGVVAQQDYLDRIPDCAAQCHQLTLPMTSCSPSDFTCLCVEEPFMSASAACNVANCTMIETLQATNETYAACGIPIRDQSATLTGVTASIESLALLMVIVRLADRAISAQAQLGYDDLLIGLSGIASLGLNIPVLMAAHYGFGRDMWGMKPDNITASLKWLYVAYFMYMVAECLCQLSILAFYLRIMVNKPLRLSVWVLIGLTTMFGIGNVFAMVFQCLPIAYTWDGWRGEMDGACYVNMQLFGVVRGGIEIFLDLAILILPLPMLAKLNMQAKKKLQIMSMFCVGFLITVVSCVRLQSMVQFATTQNQTYDNTAGIYWCTVESNLYLVVACMPAIHAILHKALRRFRDASGYGSKGQYGSDAPSNLRYSRQLPEKHKSSGVPFGVISKSTRVDIYHADRGSDSDVELVDRPCSPEQKARCT